MGPVVVLKKNDYQVKRSRIEDADAETSRVQEAVSVLRNSFRSFMTRH